MKLLKRVLFATFLLTFLLGTAGKVFAADPPRTVKIGAYNNNPKIYKDDNDQAAGVFADILKYIAEKENWNLEYIWGTWDEGLTRLEKGEIDIMVDVALSEERQKLFDFTDVTVLNSWAIVYASKDSTIDSILDLSGKKISILKSSVYQKGLEGIEQQLIAFGVEATLVEVNSYRQALDLLELGKVDAAIVSYISSLVILKDYQNLRATKIYLKPTELRFALTKGDKDNPYFIEKLDYWVKKLKAGEDGYFNKSLERNGLSILELRNEPEPQLEKTICPPLPSVKWFLATLFFAELVLILICNPIKIKLY